MKQAARLPGRSRAAPASSVKLGGARRSRATAYVDEQVGDHLIYSTVRCQVLGRLTTTGTDHMICMLTPADDPRRLCSESVRKQLASLACRKRSRAVGWPSHWAPTNVRDPNGEYGAPFTVAGAWEFVAELLDSGHPIIEITLHQPPGKTGYVMLVPLPNDRPLYIKLELGSGMVIGRSFHYSNPEGDDYEEY